MLLGGLPLLVGLGSYGLFRITGRDELLIVGLGAALGGALMVVCGLVCVWMTTGLVQYLPPEERRRRSMTSIAVLLFLLAFFPITWVTATAAVADVGASSLTIINQSGHDMTAVVVTPAGPSVAVGTIRDGGWRQVTLRNAAEGGASLRFQWKGEPRMEVPDVYIFAGSSSRVTIGSDGKSVRPPPFTADPR